MKKSIVIVVVLALAIALLANVMHAAGTGMPMMKGLKNPTELAALVESSLTSDPAGNKLLNPARCRKDGSCATAHDYFYGIQLAHPSAKLGDIADLPRYLQSLVQQPAPTGEWQISRLLVRGEKHTYDARGWHRAFLKGESVWADPNTGEFILAGDCGNVIGAAPTRPQTPLPPRLIAPPPSPPLTTPPPTPAMPTSGCPKGRVLFANAWTMESIYYASEKLGKRVETLIVRAAARDSKNASDPSAYKADDVSGSLGDEIIRVVNVRAPLNADIGVQLLDPTTLAVIEDLGNFRLVDGIATIPLSEIQLTRVEQIIWPSWFSSPTMSGGSRRILVFPEAWEKENGGRWCTRQVNAAYWERNRP
ncbi:MAG: hypothetical protein ABSB00_00855 [Minisyncoccia bacterium]